jgi:hypothetical protein
MFKKKSSPFVIRCASQVASTSKVFINVKIPANDRKGYSQLGTVCDFSSLIYYDAMNKIISSAILGVKKSSPHPPTFPVLVNA